MTDEEREQMRQFNGATINQLCELGCAIVDAYAERLRKQVSSAGDYKYAESLYLHGDLSGR